MDDDKLTEFIRRTKADPSLAEDLLVATEWDLEAAVAAYAGLNVTYERRKRESDCEEFVDLAVIHENYGESEDVATDDLDTLILKRRGKGKRATPKGLTHVADEVGEVFWKEAVSETKLTAGATKKQNVFNDEFFRHSFLYPDISGESREVQEFIAEDIIEVSHKHILEKSNRLNWWSLTGKLPRLEPLGTSGDGNCLLHAVSLYMWGLPDRDLILRTHLHRALTTGQEREGIKRRWRHVTTARNHEAGGLVFSEDEWDFEWHEIVRIATNQPRRRPTTDSLKRYSTLRVNYESLEEIHVYAMAQVLHRPIIVIADKFLRDMNNEPLAPIYFGGIYLPLECSAASCYKSPLVLAYDSSHFSPLVAKCEPKQKPSNTSRLQYLPSKQDSVIPLVSPEGLLLPLMFLHDPDKQTDIREEWSNQSFAPNDIPDTIRNLLESYFDVRWIQLDIKSKFESAEPATEGSKGFHIPVQVPKVRFPAAVVICGQEHEYQALLVTKYLESARERYESERARREKLAAERARQEEEYRRIQMNRPVPCVGKNCDMFGTQATNNLCSQCFSRSNSVQNDKASHTDVPSLESDSDSQIDFGANRIESKTTASEVDDKKWEIVLPDVPASSEQWESTASVVRKEDLAPTDHGKPDSKPHEVDLKLRKAETESHDPKPAAPKPLPKTETKSKKADLRLHETDPKTKKTDSTVSNSSSSKPVSTSSTNTAGTVTTTTDTSCTTATTTSTSTSTTTSTTTSTSTSTSTSATTSTSTSTPTSTSTSMPTSTSTSTSTSTTGTGTSGASTFGGKIVSTSSPSGAADIEKKTDAAVPKTKPPTRFSKLKSRFEPKPPKPESKGYSRDKIKPITVGKDAPATAAASRNCQNVTCKSEGCEFFGSPDHNGYCSGCYNNQPK